MNNSGIRVMIDTNIIISAVLNGSGTINDVIIKVSEPPYVLVLCDQILDELRRVFNKKFPYKIHDMERFISNARYDLVTLSSGDVKHFSEVSIRDINDRPILRAALKAGADIFITGDKDFLESDVKKPKIITASEFLIRSNYA